jgi:hypothetical protein
MDGQRPAWRLSEAVERTTASRSTLRRHLENGRLPNAYKDSSGAWRFPVEDLLAVGVSLLKSGPDIPVSVSSGRPIEQPLGDHTQRILELEHQLALERERSSGLERLAQQAQAHADGLQMALRMIEGSRHERPSEQALSVPSDRAPEVAVSGPERPFTGRARRLLAFVRGH